MHEGKRLSGRKLLTSFLVALWITLVCIGIALCKVAIYWPAFAVLNLLTIIGFTKDNIVKVFVSSVSGMVFALIYCVLGYLLSAALGQLMAYMLALFVVMFVILAFDQVLSYVCNIYAFVVFTFCTVNLAAFYANWLPTLLVALLGGGVTVAGTLGIFKLAGRQPAA